MYIQFTKMHGLGNDFSVVDLISQRAHLRPHQIKRLADRHFGVGFDQLLLIEPRVGRMWTSVIASSTPTAVKWSSAATAPAALPALSTTTA